MKTRIQEPTAPRHARHRNAGFATSVTVLAMILAASVSQGQQWRELGPAPTDAGQIFTGRISAVVCSPTDSERYFVAGADGGVWRTTDGGTI